MADVRDAVDRAVDSFMSPEGLAEWLHVPIATVYGWRQKGTGPVGIKVGKHVRYRRSDVEKWLQGQAAPERPR